MSFVFRPCRYLQAVLLIAQLLPRFLDLKREVTPQECCSLALFLLKNWSQNPILSCGVKGATLFFVQGFRLFLAARPFWFARVASNAEGPFLEHGERHTR